MVAVTESKLYFYITETKQNNKKHSHLIAANKAKQTRLTIKNAEY